MGRATVIIKRVWERTQSPMFANNNNSNNNNIAYRGCKTQGSQRSFGYPIASFPVPSSQFSVPSSQFPRFNPHTEQRSLRDLKMML